MSYICHADGKAQFAHSSWEKQCKPEQPHSAQSITAEFWWILRWRLGLYSCAGGVPAAGALGRACTGSVTGVLTGLESRGQGSCGVGFTPHQQHSCSDYSGTLSTCLSRLLLTCNINAAVGCLPSLPPRLKLDQANSQAPRHADDNLNTAWDSLASILNLSRTVSRQCHEHGHSSVLPPTGNACKDLCHKIRPLKSSWPSILSAER